MIEPRKIELIAQLPAGGRYFLRHDADGTVSLFAVNASPRAAQAAEGAGDRASAFYKSHEPPKMSRADELRARFAKRT
jgi:hypothetical protein